MALPGKIIKFMRTSDSGLITAPDRLILAQTIKGDPVRTHHANLPPANGPDGIVK